MSQALEIPLDQVTGNRGLRTGNPLNVKTSKVLDGSWDFWWGQWRADADGHAWFVDPIFGISVWIWLMWIYQSRHKIKTIQGIVDRYAPASDGNAPAPYAAAVAKEMMIPAHVPFAPSLFGPEGRIHDADLFTLCRAMAIQETGCSPISAEQWQAACALHRQRLG
jgi:hypothetical protein